MPATGWLRRYRVRAHGRVAQDQLDRLRHGITIDGVRYGPIEATVDRAQGSNVWLTFAIREGKNREVKNVLGHLGLAVNRLIRVSFGPFQLGELAEGAIEEVKTRTLRDQLGERMAAQAGADFCRRRAIAARDRQRAQLAPAVSLEVRARALAPRIKSGAGSQDDGAKRDVRSAGRKSRRDAERIGEPERARREKRRGRRPARGKRR